MAKTRAIVKNCPKCSQNVAVASKSCKCGYSFFVTRRSTRASGTGSGGSVRGSTPAEPDKGADGDCDERRRTSRVRREKPNYYDSQEYEKKKKKKDRRVIRLYLMVFRLGKCLRFRVVHRQIKCLSVKRKNFRKRPTTKNQQRFAPNEDGCGKSLRTAVAICVPSKNNLFVIIDDFVKFNFYFRLSLEKQELAAIILMEINRKNSSVFWCPS